MKSILPDNICGSGLADCFADFFEQKIRKLRDSLNHRAPVLHDHTVTPCSSALDSFSPVTAEAVARIIMRSPSKTSQLDPIPTWLLKSCVEPILPAITDIVNTSLSNGLVPPSLKSAVIFPAIKKPSLPKNDLTNYRPISNLPFVSKVKG